MYSRNVKKVELKPDVNLSMRQSFISYNNESNQKNKEKFQDYLDESIEKIKNNDEKDKLINLRNDIINMYTSCDEKIEEKVL